MNATNPKTALTPERMRELVDRGAATVVEDIGAARELISALRTAAEQLEAVRAVVRQLSHARPRRLLEEALGIADAAPQEPTEPKRMLITHPYDGHSPEDTCRDCEAPR